MDGERIITILTCIWELAEDIETRLREIKTLIECKNCSEKGKD